MREKTQTGGRVGTQSSDVVASTSEPMKTVGTAINRPADGDGAWSVHCSRFRLSTKPIDAVNISESATIMYGLACMPRRTSDRQLSDNGRPSTTFIFDCAPAASGRHTRSMHSKRLPAR